MTLYVNFGSIHSEQIGGNVYSGNFRVCHVLIWNHFQFTIDNNVYSTCIT